MTQNPGVLPLVRHVSVQGLWKHTRVQCLRTTGVCLTYQDGSSLPVVLFILPTATQPLPVCVWHFLFCFFNRDTIFCGILWETAKFYCVWVVSSSGHVVSSPVPAGLGAPAPHTSHSGVPAQHTGASPPDPSQDCLLSLGLCTDTNSLALGNKFLLHS